MRPAGPGLRELTPPPALTALEQSVVALAAMDSRRSTSPPGRLSRVMSWMFGGRPANQLADPRLEALRRFVVLVRTNRRAELPSSADALRAAGFSYDAEAEVRRLLGTIDPRRLR